MGMEWEKITSGKIKLKIYPGGIAGNEKDMIRKIKIGILGGACLTNAGINNLCPDTCVLNIPFLFNNDEEFNFVLEHLRLDFEKKIEKKGLKVIFCCMLGWVYFFSKDPVLIPDDLKQHRLSFTSGIRYEEDVWKQAGYYVVQTELKDLHMALKSGMVSAFYLPPLVAASGQYFGVASYMCDLKIAPVICGIVFSKMIWNKIPGQFKEPMLRITSNLANKLQQETKRLEKESIQQMLKHGLIINQIKDGATTKWKEAAEKGIESLTGRVFSEEIYHEVLDYLAGYRSERPIKLKRQ